MKKVAHLSQGLTEDSVVSCVLQASEVCFACGLKHFEVLHTVYIYIYVEVF